MKNTIFTDLFSNKFAQQQATEAATEAAKLYKPKTFLETYFVAYKASSFCALIGGGVSVVAALFFVLNIVQSFCPNYYLALTAAAALLVGFEFLKSKILSFSFKELFASRFNFLAIGASALLLAFSIYSSLEGAKQYVKASGATVTDSLTLTASTTLNATLNDLEQQKKEAKNDLKAFKKSVAYKGKINTNNPQILAVINEKEKQVSLLDTKISEAKNESSEATGAKVKTVTEATNKTATTTVIFCGLIELLIVCALGFRYYFLSNVYKETTTTTRDHPEASGATFTTTTTPINTPRPTHSPIGFRLYDRDQEATTTTPTTRDQEATNPETNPEGCAHCGAAFKRKTTWQKYCNPECKVAAWEAKTGKKFKTRSS
jgi:hypothetical protein